FEELEDEVDVAVFDDGEDLGEAGVTQLGREPRLVEEARQLLGRAARAALELLDGHAALEGEVLGLVHHAHAAAAQLLDDLEVAAQGRARRQIPWGGSLLLRRLFVRGGAARRDPAAHRLDRLAAALGAEEAREDERQGDHAEARAQEPGARSSTRG